MPVRDLNHTTQEFLEASDREFAVGDTLKASEKLWGAAGHAIMAVAQQRGLEYGTHRTMINSARQVADEQDDERLRSGILAVRHFHSNSTTAPWNPKTLLTTALSFTASLPSCWLYSTKKAHHYAQPH